MTAKKKKPAKKRGRPRKPISEATIRRLAEISCTDDEIEKVLGISSSTLQNFREVIQTGRAKAKMSLRRGQMKLAMGGNATMQIWLGKQMLGQKDKFEHGGPDGGPIPFADLSREENEKRIQELLARTGSANA